MPRGARACPSGSPLLEYRQESSKFDSSMGPEGRSPRPRLARRKSSGTDALKRRAGRSASEPTLELQAAAVGDEAAMPRGARRGWEEGRAGAATAPRRRVGRRDSHGNRCRRRLLHTPAGQSSGCATSELPVAPLLAFLLIFDAGYLVVLTAFGGQTIGKKAVGLRVESGSGEPVTIATSVVRTAAYAVSVLPAGVGLLGVLLRQRNTLHDLIARTRVVRVA